MSVLEGRRVWVRSIAFSPDGTLLALGDGKAVKLYEAYSGQLLRTIEGHAFDVTSVAFSPEGRRVLSGGEDGTLRIWSVASGGLLASMAAKPTDEWLVTTPEGFFAGSGEAVDQILTLVRGLDATTINQVHQSLFSPDLVRETLAGDPEGEVRDAAQSINLEKVLASGPAPLIKHLQVELGPSTSDIATVQARVTDLGKGIGRIEWRVNGITAAVEAKPDELGPEYKLTRQLALDPGENVIEVVAYNGTNLLASLPSRITAKLTGTANASKPKLHILAIGINAYNDRGWTPPGHSDNFYFSELTLAVNDAKTFGNSIKRAAARLYAECALNHADGS